MCFLFDCFLTQSIDQLLPASYYQQVITNELLPTKNSNDMGCDNQVVCNGELSVPFPIRGRTDLAGISPFSKTRAMPAFHLEGSAKLNQENEMPARA